MKNACANCKSPLGEKQLRSHLMLFCSPDCRTSFRNAHKEGVAFFLGSQRVWALLPKQVGRDRHKGKKKLRDRA